MKIKTNQELIVEYIIMRIDMFRKTIKHLKLKIIVFFHRLFRSAKCFFGVHEPSKKITRWNGIVTYYCPCCKEVFPEESEKDYDVNCVIHGKRMALPLLKVNDKTIKVGIGNKIIDRHLMKHGCIFTSFKCQELYRA